MKKLIYVAVMVFAFAPLHSQTIYKLRTFGLGLHYEVGYALPSVGGSNQNIDPRFYFGRLDLSKKRTWASFNGNIDEHPFPTSTIGASLSYRHSTKRYAIVSFEAGFSQTRVVNYYNINSPFYDQSFNLVTGFYDWYYYNKAHFDFQVAISTGKRKRFFWYIKTGGTYGWAASKLIPDQKNNYYSGMSDYQNPILYGNNAVLTATNTVGYISKGTIGVMGSSGIQMHFGKRGRHVLQLGIGAHIIPLEFAEQTFTLSELPQGGTNYTYVSLKPNYLYWDISYTFPIKGSKRLYDTYTPSPRTPSRPTKPVNPKPKVPQPQPQPRPQPQPTPQPQPIPQPQPQVSPDIIKLENGLQSCFSVKNSKSVKWYEDPIQIAQDNIELDFYDTEPGKDGDVISVCINGKMFLNNLTLTELGETVKFSMPQGTNEVIMIVKIVSEGGTPRCHLGIDLSKLGSNKQIEMTVEKNDYWWFKIVR